MNKLAFLLLILPLAAFSCTYAPFQTVISHNDMLAASLLGSGCLNSSATIYSNPIRCAEISLLSAYPSVDARISAARGAEVVWRYAYSASDKDLTSTDANGCTSYFHKTFQDADVSASLTARFRGRNYSADISGTSPAEIPVPKEILNESQGDTINLSLDGRIVFHYILDSTISSQQCDPISGSCTCVDDVSPSEPFNITRAVSTNLAYTVESGKPIYFLTKPVLHEQWSGNSVIEETVFSNTVFQCAQVSMESGGSLSAGAEMHGFNVTEDRFGLWSINTTAEANRTGMSARMLEQRSTPGILENTNTTFAYIYILGTSYDSTGFRTFDLNLTDDFGNNYSTRLEIASRLATFGNSTAEDGSTNITDANTYRPSAPLPRNSFTFIIAGVGALGVIALIFALSRKD